MTITTAQSEERPVALIAVSVETLIYVGLVAGAFILHAARLGEPLLGDVEAPQAIAAQRLLETGSATPGVIESPVTFAALVVSLAMAGASTAAARFLPMLAGIGLVFSPLLFRARLRPLPTLITIALLAVSPSLLASSRLVGGYTFGMLALIVCLWAMHRHLVTARSRWLLVAGIALGIAILSDFGMLAAVAAVLLGVTFAIFTDEEGELEELDLRGRLGGVPWRLFLFALLATILAVSTLFYLAPNGLGAAANLISRFGSGLLQRPEGVPWMGFMISIYELGLVIFGLIGAWLASQSSTPSLRFLAGWGFAALLIALLYPGAMPGHILWAVVPLAALSALSIESLLRIDNSAPRWVPWAHAAGVVALAGMVLLSVAQQVRAPYTISFPINPAPGQPVIAIPLNLTLAGVWLIMQLVLWFSVSFTWDSLTAMRGLGLGLLVLHILGATGQSGALAFTRANSAYEPLHIASAQPGLALLVATARDVSNLAEGTPVDAPITVQAAPDSTLAWALRDFKNVTFVEQADPRVNTVLVITPADGVNPALGSAYVGQDFLIVRRWTPTELSAAQFAYWLLYRTAPTPTQDTRVILWVREDIYRLVPAQQR